MKRTAVLAFDDICRMELSRIWDETKPVAAWLMQNPSVADAEIDDPTIGRVCYFSKKLGAGGAVVVNYVPYRATDPADMLRALRSGVITPEMLSENRRAIARVAAGAAFRVAAFGVPPAPVMFHARRAANVFLGGELAFCLGHSPGGFPLHPLARGKFAIRNEVEPMPWKGFPV